MVRCRLCGKAFRTINQPHLWHKHGWHQDHPVRVYLRRFRIANPWGQAAREKQRECRKDHFDRIGRTWNPERVLSEIRKRSAAGLPLNVPHLRKSKTWTLYECGCKFFRSWGRAVEAAGLNGRLKRSGWWNRDRVIETIRRRHSTGKAVTFQAVREEDNPLLCAGRDHFGTWQAALQAAGMPLEARYALRHKWRADRIQEQAG